MPTMFQPPYSPEQVLVRVCWKRSQPWGQSNEEGTEAFDAYLGSLGSETVGMRSFAGSLSL